MMVSLGRRWWGVGARRYRPAPVGPDGDAGEQDEHGEDAVMSLIPARAEQRERLEE